MPLKSLHRAGLESSSTAVFLSDFKSPENFSTFPLEGVDGLWATKSDGVGLIVRDFAQLVSKIFNLCGPDSPTSRTDSLTDRHHAISIQRYAL